jgi:hypothetical protein
MHLPAIIVMDLAIGQTLTIYLNVELESALVLYLTITLVYKGKLYRAYNKIEAVNLMTIIVIVTCCTT